MPDPDDEHSYRRGKKSTRTSGKSKDEFKTPQHKKLSNGEIRKLQENGIDVHELKADRGGGRTDLFKDKNGNIFSKPKSGSGQGEPTGLNIRDFL